MNKIIIGALFTGGLGLAVFMPGSPVLAQDAGNNATPVIVSTVIREHFSDEVEALGTLKANEGVDLTATVTEWVTTIHFEDGQRVNKGDIILEMDIAEENAEMAEQQSFLDEAERQLARLEPLVQKGATSESALDKSRREMLGATARVDAIRSRIDQRIIKAPFDGVLGLRNISVGALVQPGTVITTIDDDSTMKLDFSVPEVFLSTLEPGVDIKATTRAYPEREFIGTIASVDSRIDPITRSIQARALIDNKDGALKPGLLMQVDLHKNPRRALVVPEEALIPDGSDNFVLVIKRDGEKTTAERRKVELGTRQYGKAEIAAGLSEGDLVVTHGTLRVRPGAPLEITAVEDEDRPLHEMLAPSAGLKAQTQSEDAQQ